jgi:hypothetical protein
MSSVLSPSQAAKDNGSSATTAAVSRGLTDLEADWRWWLTGCTVGLLLFEALTGLAIYLLPFSVFNQFGVLMHTVVGVAMVLPVGWYLGWHWWRRFRTKFSHHQLLGYLSAAVLAVLCVSGFVLTWQGLFSSRVSYAWDLAHLVTGLALIFTLGAHLVILWIRKVYAPSAVAALRQAKRSFLASCGGVTLALLAVHAGWALLYTEPALNNDFPADYSWKFGKDRPFAPSLGHTATNWAYDPTTLAWSVGCGSTDCHGDIVREWEPSAHRYASADVAFQAVQRLMLDDVGAEATRYCAGCHDPVALFSGSKNVNVEGLTSPGADEGVSCIACHSVIQTDVRGNADYTVTQPVRYVGERREGTFYKRVSDFLIRTYPEHHKQSFARPLYKTAEFCAACHKQFIDEEVNQIGWVQLQNQYDNWRQSRWYHEGDAKKSISCRECHMPLVDSTDPAAGDTGDYNRSEDDGKHRSHRFLAANQIMPLLMKLPGAQEHVDLTEAWLRGEIEIPEIADKWTSGPVIRLELAGSAAAKPGEPVELQVVLTNNKTGHGFPTGPLDIIRSWVEITVQDDQGRMVYQTGQPSEDGVMSENALVFKAVGIDRYGNDIDEHNLWEMVGARFKRALFPGSSDTETYSFSCPGLSSPPVQQMDTDRQEVAFDAPSDLQAKELRVTAVLKYQKADAAFLDRLFGVEAGIRTPATVLASDTLIIPIER